MDKKEVLESIDKLKSLIILYMEDDGAFWSRVRDEANYELEKLEEDSHKW